MLDAAPIVVVGFRASACYDRLSARPNDERDSPQFISETPKRASNRLLPRTISPPRQPCPEPILLPMS